MAMAWRTHIYSVMAFTIFLMLVLNTPLSEAYASSKLLRRVQVINKAGVYLGLVIPNAYEMNPLLQPPTFIADSHRPYIDISGRRFHMGTVMNHSVIVVMTGLGMINAGITTQLLLTLFRVSGVIHYGIAGNANSDFHIGDVTIPRQWAHTGLWSWQRYGQGTKDKLPLEENGDYSRKIGYLKFSHYNTPQGNNTNNVLNNLWYQQDEIFPVNGTPEVREHVFWINVSESYYKIAEQIEQNVSLVACVNSTCLSHKPKIVRVERGCSANIYVDNAAYRNFLHTKFNVTPVDMESAGIALVCQSQRKPFIIMRALSDLAGGSNEENEAGVFTNLAAINAVKVVTQFINLL